MVNRKKNIRAVSWDINSNKSSQDLLKSRCNGMVENSESDPYEP